MKDKMIKVARGYFSGQIGKHLLNADNMLTNPVGIGEHSDIMAELELQLAKVAEYEEKLAVLDKYFSDKEG